MSAATSAGLSPVRFRDGHYQAHEPDRGWRAICRDGQPVRRLVHGWHPVGLYRGFGRVLLLELRHGSGREASWFLDPSQALICNDLDRLPADALQALAALVVPALRRLRDVLLAGDPDGTELDPLGLHALNPDTIARLIGFAGDRLAPPPTLISLDAVGPGQQAIAVGGTSLSVAALRACLAPRMQQQHMAVLAGGAYEAVCPFTGATLRTTTTILEDRTSACRFEAPASGAEPARVFYLCNNPVISERELFIPSLNCTLALRVPEHADRLFARLLAAVVQHAGVLPGYLGMRKRPANILTPFPGLHVGHVLWNELTGLDRIRRALPAEALPMVIVPNPEAGTEVFGPVERILPEFDGKVLRLPARDVAGLVYREGLTAMRVYDEYVSRHLAARVGLVARQDAAVEPDHALASELRGQGRPVILIGLRVHNRTVPDQVGLWRGVIEHLSHRLGPVAVVIDGINARLQADPSTDYGTFGPRGPRAPVLDELQIVIELRRHFQGDDVTLINMVGAPVARSLFWAQQALFFVSLWGAGLAKYRWVANKPGLVLTNRVNLDHPEGSVRIYHAPELMEAPTALDFIAPEHVTDRAASDFHGGFYNDFTVDPAGLDQALDRLLARVAEQGGRDAG